MKHRFTGIYVIVIFIGFDAADSAKRMFTAFGPGTPYDNPKIANIKDKSELPVIGPWPDRVLLRFVKCYSAGKNVSDLEEGDENDDPDNISRLVAVVACYAGKPELLDQAEDVALQLQTSDVMVAVLLTVCRVMEQYILHGESRDGHIEKTIEELKSRGRLHPLDLDRAMAGHLQAALDSRSLSVAEATKKFGKA